MNSKIIKQGLDQIASIDSDVKKGLDLVGYPEPRIRPEGFESLLAIILGQQISTEAGSSIRKRLDGIWSEKNAGSFLRFTEETLRGIGFSRRKIEYAKGIALAIEEGELEIHVMKSDYDLTDIPTLKAGEFGTVKPGEFHYFVCNNEVSTTDLHQQILHCFFHAIHALEIFL